MVRTISDPDDCEIRADIRFLKARNVKPAGIYPKIYSKYAMTRGMVRMYARKCVRKFNECQQMSQ